MKEFIISDTHFAHANIIKYCNRPFSSVEEMDEYMVKKWNSVVGKDDIVWHLGDFGMGDKETIKRYRERLNGRIFLILGNHDNHTIQWYYDCGFDKVYDRPIIWSNYFIFSHHPRELQADIYGYFYGHVHTWEEYKDYTEHTFCVCTERLNYTPILIKDALKLMKNYGAAAPKL